MEINGNTDEIQEKYRVNIGQLKKEHKIKVRVQQGKRRGKNGK